MKIVVGLAVVSLILSILIGLSIANQKDGKVDETSAKKDKFVIGLSMDTLKEARWQVDKDTMIAEAKKKGVELLIQSANSDDTRQMQDIQALISRKVDLLIIIPHNGKAMTKAVKIAKEAGIPVVAYDRMIDNCDLDLYITFDNVKVGELQAQYLVDKLNGKGRIVRLYGAPTDNNAKMFKEGQDKVLAPYIKDGSIKVVHEDWVQNWDPANAKKIMNAAITNVGHNFDGVLASNDGTAGGAIQSLLEEGLAGKKIVTGQDSELAAIQRIVAGNQSMSIYKPLKALATKAIDVSVDMLNGKVIIADSKINNGAKDVPTIFMTVYSVDKNNIEDTVIKGGLHSKEAIYGKK